MTSPDIVGFLREAVKTGKFDHPNVLKLKGISLNDDLMPMMVLPFMENGDLRTFVKDAFYVRLYTITEQFSEFCFLKCHFG